MRTSELTGALLDYWVAVAVGEKAYIRRERATMNNEEGSLHTVLFDEDRCFRKRWNEESEPASECKGAYWLNYSRNWELAGPVIERERINVNVSYGPDSTSWVAYFDLADNEAEVTQYGPAPLVAAMRAYVASKFGDEVSDSVGTHKDAP